MPLETCLSESHYSLALSFVHGNTLTPCVLSGTLIKVTIPFFRGGLYYLSIPEVPPERESLDALSGSSFLDLKGHIRACTSRMADLLHPPLNSVHVFAS